MDISMTTAPDSTQVNAEDFLAGPRTVTITGVRAGNADQPVNIDLAEYPDRAYRPGKTMRRVLLAAWGSDSSKYVGRRLRLFCDPDVKWGGQNVGGIRIAAMSDISKPLDLSLTVTRGKRAHYRVQPLAEQTPSERVTELRAQWSSADPDRRKQIKAQVAELTKPADQNDGDLFGGDDA